jgi:hypothetical protein
MKREPVGNDDEQDNWLGTTLRRTPATAPDDCLDAETLAAWADGGLGGKAAAAVDLHASQCSRCTAVLAAIERTAPVAPARHAWTPARLVRWLVPLTAAATAVAIWIAVPDRPVAPVEESAAVQDLARSAPEPMDLRLGGRSEEAAGSNQSTAPRAGNPESLNPAVPPAPVARRDNQAAGTDNRAAKTTVEMRDEDRRERVSQDALDAKAAAPGAAAAPAAPPAAAPTGRLAETAATTAMRSAFSTPVFSTESVSPSNQLIRWRVVAPGTIERSTDGGKTWTGTTSPAPTLTGVRAVDADRAVVRSTDITDFYTSNGGLSWTRVQENSAAPF